MPRMFQQLTSTRVMPVPDLARGVSHAATAGAARAQRGLLGLANARRMPRRRVVGVLSPRRRTRTGARATRSARKRDVSPMPGDRAVPRPCVVRRRALRHLGRAERNRARTVAEAGDSPHSLTATNDALT